jgi:hypothetical protein
MQLKSVCLIVAVLFVFAEKKTPASDVVDVAARFIGRPYVWGAEGPKSFDCSGLTQYVFGEFAVDLPRRAISQSRAGEAVGRRLQRGDLLFFSTDTRRTLVTHVGIYEGSGRMIEASKSAGRVRRSNINDAYWVKRFISARRVMSGGVDGNRRSPEDGERTGEPSRTRQVRNAAVRALGELAGALLRRPRR